MIWGTRISSYNVLFNVRKSLFVHVHYIVQSILRSTRVLSGLWMEVLSSTAFGMFIDFREPADYKIITVCRHRTLLLKIMLVLLFYNNNTIPTQLQHFIFTMSNTHYPQGDVNSYDIWHCEVTEKYLQAWFQNGTNKYIRNLVYELF